MKSIVIYILIWFVKYTRFWRFHKVPTLVIFSQAALETKSFSSSVFKDLNNLFGMNHPEDRDTTSLGNSGRKEFVNSKGYATYSNWYQSIVDYFLRQEYFRVLDKMSNYSGTEEDRYQNATQLTRYATSPTYIAGWNLQIMKYQFYRVISIAMPFLLGFLTLWAFSDQIKKDLYKRFKKGFRSLKRRFK